MVAASKDQYEALKLLIENGAEVNARNDGGVTALMWAVNKGSISSDTIKIVQLLIRNGADVNAKTARGKSALNWAEDYEHKTLVKILKDSGAKQ